MGRPGPQILNSLLAVDGRLHDELKQLNAQALLDRFINAPSLSFFQQVLGCNSVIALQAECLMGIGTCIQLVVAGLNCHI